MPPGPQGPEPPEAPVGVAADLALEAARMGTWAWDLGSSSVRWSGLVEPLFGLAPGTFHGTFAAYLDLIHPADRARVQRALEAALEGGSDDYVIEHRVLWPDGALHWLEGKGSVVRDAAGKALRMTGTVVDVTLRRAAVERLQRANRALGALGRCHRALVRATSEPELLGEICRVITDRGGYRMAWVGFKEDDENRTVRVAAHAGEDAGYLAKLGITWADTDRGRGPTGTAVRTGLQVVCRDFETDPQVAPWRADALARGFHSSLVLPLKRDGVVFGALSVYASQTDAFDEEEVGLLAHLAEDLAYGIQALRARAAQLAAERAHDEVAAALRASEERLRSATLSSPIGMALVSAEGRILEANPALCRLLGRSLEELRGVAFQEITHPDDLAESLLQMRRLLTGELESAELEKRYLHKDGSSVWAQLNVSMLAATESTPRHFVAQVQDITARRRADQALRRSQEKLLGAMDLARLVHWEYDVASNALTFDEGFEKLFRAPAPGGPLAPDEYARRYLLPDEVERYRDELARALLAPAPEGTRTLEHRILRGDGTSGWLAVRYSVARDATGRPVSIQGASQDITERRRGEEALEQQRRRLEAIIESALDGIITIDRTQRIVVFNRAAERMFGCRAADALGKPLDRFIPPGHREAHAGHVRAFGVSVTTAGAMGGGLRPIHGLRTSGEEFPIEAYISHVELQDQSLFSVTLRDVSERHAADRALRESEERLRQVAENLQEVVWMADLGTDEVLYVSPAFERIWGLPADRLYHRREAWLDAIHPEDRERVRAALAGRVDGSYDEEYRVIRPDGGMRLVHDRAFPIRDALGRGYRAVGVAEDITERRRTEEQIRQAQKLEAIGQLAGGVAHDFNNIVGAILIQADLAVEQTRLPPDALECLREIKRTAQRAAELTRQLLLFGRKQVMKVRRLDLNEVVTGIVKMLQRVLREDVRMQLRLHPRPLLIDADAGMLDQVLMNLAVNARDAMPAGGRLVIETTAELVGAGDPRLGPELGPGSYACLRVTDSGAGIAPENLGRIFEPFFTTKDVGQGTGLGLATVFGIVKQHRGGVSVTSTPGAGTTFQVLLPPSTGRERAPERAELPRPRGGSETVLVVEDDGAVRAATCRILQRLGYHVLEAAHATDALRAWEQDGPRIRLLLTDLVMPEGLNGRELAAELRARAPGLKVILTSGYSEELAGRDLLLPPGQVYLPKPYEARQLLALVRDLLDS